MNEEYTYNIGKYTVGVDTNEEDGIGLTIAIINDDGEIHFLGNCYGDNARFIDLLIKENKQLKDNWNELKNIIEKGIIDNKAGSSQQYYFNTIYKYMQELEQGKDE